MNKHQSWWSLKDEFENEILKGVQYLDVDNIWFKVEELFGRI